MAYRDAVLADSPLSFWEQQETSGTTAADTATPGGNTGTSSTITFVSTGFASLGNCYQYNGSSSQISIADNGSLLDFAVNQSFTAEAFVYQSAGDNAYRRIFSKEGSDGSGRQGWNLWWNWGTNQLASERFRDGAANAVVYSANSSGLNVWHHVAIVYDGTGLTMTLYLDGSQVAQALSASKQLSDTTFPLYIGNSTWGGSDHWNGRLCYCALYNTALNSAQIQSHFNALAGGNLRTTQVAAETIIAPQSNLRTTQVTAEAIVSPQSNLRTTQMVAEVVVAPLPQTPAQGQTIVIR